MLRYLSMLTRRNKGCGFTDVLTTPQRVHPGTAPSHACGSEDGVAHEESAR